MSPERRKRHRPVSVPGSNVQRCSDCGAERRTEKHGWVLMRNGIYLAPGQYCPDSAIKLTVEVE